MAQTNFRGLGIRFTLKNFRQLISAFPKHAGSVSVVSHDRIQSQIKLWNQLLPRVKPYYAVKCNPDRILLQSLLNSGAGFDCASLREVDEVISLTQYNSALEPKIIYAHPMKSERDICRVDSLKIDTTVVDSLEECIKLAECEWKGTAFLRVAVSDSKSKMPFSTKFGASYDEVKQIAAESNVPISGVSFHVGSGCTNPEQYRDAIKYSAGDVFDILRRYGHAPTTIDIGGGFSAEEAEFIPAANIISEALKLYVPRNRFVIAEPGRYMAQPFQDLFVRIIAKKPGVNGSIRYVIDESLYGHFSCIPFDHQKPSWIHIPSEERITDNKKVESILFGRTCDSLDVIAKGPMELMDVGDWLYFPMMGAYTSATASEFNGFPKPESMVDLQGLLPDAKTAWGLHANMHSMRPLKYSNALVSMD